MPVCEAIVNDSITADTATEGMVWTVSVVCSLFQ